uniref:TIL domain-containing protein n=1 Tax=Steinernema glaseri TaxID=37863 RepID=A0A1I8AUU1_9BILA
MSLYFVLFLVIGSSALSVPGSPSSSESSEECPTNYISGRYTLCEAKCGESVPICVDIEIPWIREECHCRADKGFAVAGNGDCIPRRDCEKDSGPKIM